MFSLDGITGALWKTDFFFFKVHVFIDDLWRLFLHFCLPANVAISDNLWIV